MKFIAVTLPLALLIALTFLAESLKKIIPNLTTYVLTTASIGIIGGALIYTVILITNKKIKIAPPIFGKLYFLLIGGGLGALSSFLSAAMFYVVHKPQLTSSLYIKEPVIQVLGNIFPAIVEELSIRGALVNVLCATISNFAGILGSGIFFGFIHLVGRFFGNPVDLSHVVGYGIAGILLAVLYIRYGLFCAIGWHCIWNALLTTWTHTFNMGLGGTQTFECTWTTNIVLILTSIPMIIMIMKKKKIPKYQR